MTSPEMAGMQQSPRDEMTPEMCASECDKAIGALDKLEALAAKVPLEKWVDSNAANAFGKVAFSTFELPVAAIVALSSGRGFEAAREDLRKLKAQMFSKHGE